MGVQHYLFLLLGSFSFLLYGGFCEPYALLGVWSEGLVIRLFNVGLNSSRCRSEFSFVCCMTDGTDGWC